MMYSVRTAMERLNTQTFHLARVTGKLSKSRRNDGHRVADLFPNDNNLSHYIEEESLSGSQWNSQKDDTGHGITL